MSKKSSPTRSNPTTSLPQLNPGANPKTFTFHPETKSPSIKHPERPQPGSTTSDPKRSR